LSGRNFEKEDVVDFTSLFIVTQALSEAKSLIRRLSRAFQNYVPSSPIASPDHKPVPVPNRSIEKLTILDHGKEDTNVGFVKNVNTNQILSQFRTSLSNVDDLPSNFVFINNAKKQVEVEEERNLTVNTCIAMLSGKESILVKTYSETLLDKLSFYDTKGESLGFLKGISLKSNITDVRPQIQKVLGVNVTFKFLDKEADPVALGQERDSTLQECLVTKNGKTAIVIRIT